MGVGQGASLAAGGGGGVAWLTLNALGCVT